MGQNKGGQIAYKHFYALFIKGDLVFGELINIALFKTDLRSVENKATIGSGLFYYLATIIVIFVVSLIINFMLSITNGIKVGADFPSMLWVMIGTTILSLFVAFVSIIIGIIFSLACFVFVNIVAKMFGGKGDYPKTTAMLFITGSAIAITYSLPLQIMVGLSQIILTYLGAAGTIIGAITILRAIISIIICVIATYLQSKAIGVVHNISTLKGFLSLIIPAIGIGIVLTIILVLLTLFGIALFAPMATMALI
jgi:hypothetical protein